MENNKWNELVAQSDQELVACREGIENSNSRTSQASTEGKSGVISHLKTAFGELETLAQYVSGDYDARVKARELAPAAVESPLIASLVQSVQAAFGSSEAIASVAKKEVISIMTARTKIGTLKDSIDKAKGAADQEIITLQQHLEGKRDLVKKAEMSKSVAEGAFNDARTRSEQAEADAKWWKEYAEYKPPWYLALLGGGGDQGRGMMSQATDRLLFALKQKEAAAIEARALEERQKELLEHQMALHRVEVEKAQVETALTELQHVQTNASRTLHDCEIAITRCTEVEEAMTVCKQTLNSILTRCTSLEELVTRGDYVQTKSDHVEVILECLAQGTFDSALVDQAKAVIQTLETGDSTGLLKEASFANLQMVVKGLIGGVADLGPLVRL